MDETGLRFSDTALQRIIREYTYEAGVRNLEREIGRVIRKVARLKAESKQYPTLVNPPMVERLLGPPQFFQSEAERRDEVGVATSLAWTENGGEIMSIEVAVLEGKGGLQMTGQIGEVMQESGQAALTFIKSRAEAFGVDLDVFERMDIHVHMPEGAIPKDGPSAGITLATAMLSALTGRPVYREVGMTGEITLRGSVLPVGGIKEKVLAAHRAGLRRVVLPERNQKDLVDIPDEIRKSMELVFVRRIDEVLALVLEPVAVLTPDLVPPDDATTSSLPPTTVA
jgi:ATP-dependent Lon protease